MISALVIFFAVFFFEFFCFCNGFCACFRAKQMSFWYEKSGWQGNVWPPLRRTLLSKGIPRRGLWQYAEHMHARTKETDQKQAQAQEQEQETQNKDRRRRCACAHTLSPSPSSPGVGFSKSQGVGKCPLGPWWEFEIAIVIG